MPTTPMVFSSHSSVAACGSMWKRSPSMGIWRASTSLDNPPTALNMLFRQLDADPDGRRRGQPVNSSATRLIVVARTVVPKTYDSRQCRRTIERIAESDTLVSETCQVMPRL